MRKMRKTQTALAALVLVTSICFSSQAFAWGSATHAYISDHSGKGERYPLQNLNEIYGSMAPDAFAYLFEYPALIDVMYWMTHYDAHPPGVPDNVNLPSYMDLWAKPKTTLGKAAAWGFVSHNGETGGDATAHGHYDYSDPDGYVIAKAVQMVAGSSLVSQLNILGIEGRLLYELCHIFIESAVDIRLAEANPSLGCKISAAALSRTPEFASNFADTFAGPLALVSRLLMPAEPIPATTAFHVIRKAENDFRSKMVSYGYALTQKNAKELVAENLADVAIDYLGAYQAPIDNIPRETISQLAYGLLMDAYANYTDDCSSAINATLARVRAAMH